jgi:hypothetical protein
MDALPIVTPAEATSDTDVNAGASAQHIKHTVASAVAADNTKQARNFEASNPAPSLAVVLATRLIVVPKKIPIEPSGSSISNTT